MPRPDLSTPEGHAAYRGELRLVAWPWRLGGMAVVVCATTLLVYARTSGAGVFRSTPGIAGLVLMAAGWAALFVAIARRSAHHRKRMSEEG